MLAIFASSRNSLSRVGSGSVPRSIARSKPLLGLLSYEALGLCERGGAQRFVDDGDNTYGGQVVTNPSGGLLSKGHPLGATGLAQCTELVQQLRGTADKRQVAGARLALQHNLGLGGACVVTMYEKV